MSRKIVSVLLFMLIWLQACYAADIKVFVSEDNTCYAAVGDKKYRCSIGRHGLKGNKREGDGCTPQGVFSLREIFIRYDKINKDKLPKLALPVRAIKPNFGWCDDPKSEYYNKFVDLKHFDTKVSHENLYLDNDLYDIIVVVGYNDAPVIADKGSAIFIHIARDGYKPTAGCVAFAKNDLLAILGKLTRDSKIII